MEKIAPAIGSSRLRLKTPVLLIVFNRLDTTKQVLDSIRQAKTPRLYIAADGSRRHITGEDLKVQAVRDYVMTHIDWACEVKTLFRENNLGCKYAVSGAINWFFENEEMGIILEDDCLPNQSFFWFCEELLDRYQDDERVGHISGFNPFSEFPVYGESYLFSKFGSIWGWASWRRAWSQYDVCISRWKEIKARKLFSSLMDSKMEEEWRTKIFDRVFLNQIDTWDYQWSFAKLINSFLSIVPARNLVRNIGFGDGATHTLGKNDKRSEKMFEINHLKHPVFIIRNKEFETQYLRKFAVKKINFKKIARKVFPLKIKTNRGR